MATDILTMTYDEILSIVTELGFPAFRAKQLYQWLNKGALFDEMNYLPKAFKEAL